MCGFENSYFENFDGWNSKKRHFFLVVLGFIFNIFTLLDRLEFSNLGSLFKVFRRAIKL
jgi:hypothetical protein